MIAQVLWQHTPNELKSKDWCKDMGIQVPYSIISHKDMKIFAVVISFCNLKLLLSR